MTIKGFFKRFGETLILISAIPLIILIGLFGCLAVFPFVIVSETLEEIWLG